MNTDVVIIKIPMLIRSRAPVRVDWAGGWTDVALFTEGQRGAVVNAAGLVGMVARSNIKRGQIVTESDVTRPVLVPRNSAVTLVVAQGRLRITTR